MALILHYQSHHLQYEITGYRLLPYYHALKLVLQKNFNIVDLIILTKLENSKSEIKRLIKGNAIKINNENIIDEKFIIEAKLFDKNFLKLSIGKKRHIKIVIY